MKAEDFLKEDPSILEDGKPIQGLELMALARAEDPRGAFVEMFREGWGAGIDPVQWSVVHSVANVLRGPHVHRRHDEYFALASGRARVGLRDVRRASPSFGSWCLLRLSAERPVAIVFPRGVLHGWYFDEDSIHLQGVSESYSQYHPEDNLGCQWADPDLEIPWPAADPIVSPRAAAFPSLAELLRILDV